MSQVYVGMSGETTRATEAVDSTRNIVLTWRSRAGEKIFCTYFSSTCGGVTQDAANIKSYGTLPRPEPLSGGVRCMYCRQAPHYNWPAVRMSKQTVTERLAVRYPKLRQLGPVDRIEVIERTPEGRPKRIAVVGTRGSDVLRSEDLRLSLGPMTVKSTQCRIQAEGDDIVFSAGRGFGHGMGMCQWGAEGLARLGGSADSILKFYYPQSRFVRTVQ
jgi:stage II sporulation protein D